MTNSNRLVPPGVSAELPPKIRIFLPLLFDQIEELTKRVEKLEAMLAKLTPQEFINSTDHHASSNQTSEQETGGFSKTSRATGTQLTETFVGSGRCKNKRSFHRVQHARQYWDRPAVAYWIKN